MTEPPKGQASTCASFSVLGISIKSSCHGDTFANELLKLRAVSHRKANF
jgi:hypothetical protein